MGKHFDSIQDNLRDWALQQPMFWVASAPWRGKHINVSPKGMPGSTFTIFDATHCAYVDATGSGSETIPHIYENGRVTLCWCSFDTTPRILRFYCWGSVIEHDDERFFPMLDKMGHERVNGARAIILLEVWKVGTSCGMAVPLLEVPQSAEEELKNDSSIPMETTAPRLFKERQSLKNWAGRMEGNDKILGYRRQKNSTSLDGLPGIRVARRQQGMSRVADWFRMHAARTLGETRGFVLGVLMMLVVLVMMWSAGSLRSLC